MAEGTRRFTEPTGAGTLAAALAPVAVAIVGGTWLMLGGPPAVVLGATTAVPLFLAASTWHLISTRRFFLDWELDRAGVTAGPLKAGWFGRRPWRFEWGQIGAVERWRKCGRSGVILFIHDKPPSEAVRRLKAPPHMSRDAEFRRLIEQNIAQARIQGAFALKDRRRLPRRFVTWGAALLLLASGVLAGMAILEKLENVFVWHAWAFHLPVQAVVLALILLVRPGTRKVRALLLGLVLAVYSLLLLSAVAAMYCNVTERFVISFAGTAGGLAAGLGLLRAAGGKLPRACSIALVYSLCLAGFGAVWFTDRSIPIVRLNGTFGIMDPWSPTGDGFVLDTNWRPTLNFWICRVTWFEADGRRAGNRSPHLWIYTSLVGQEGALAVESGHTPHKLWYVPRYGKAMNLDVSIEWEGQWITPDGRWGVCKWYDKSETADRWLRVDMRTGEVEHTALPTDAKPPQPRSSLRRSRFFDLEIAPWGGHRTYIIDSATGQRAPLPTTAWSARQLAWSPDGKRVLVECLMYKCRFSDERWWHCFEADSWLDEFSALVILDSPEAKRLFGR